MASHDHLFLGIDIGTQGVRALAVSQHGRVVAEASVSLGDAVVQPQPGRHEQSPHAWWKATCSATHSLMDRLTAAGASPGQLAAVALDGTSGTVVPLGDAGEPLRPAMMYNDPRAKEEGERLNQSAGEFCRKLGYQFNSSFGLAKIAWLQAHEPATVARTVHFVHQADYVAGRLTGQPGVSDYSNALKTGYDLVDECWPGWIGEMLGLSERLPKVVPPGTPIGVVSAMAAAETRLPKGMAVVAGATDGTTAFLASGTRRPGDYNTSLGTTLIFKEISREICRHPDGLIYCHKLPGGLWLPGAASNTGGQWIGVRFPGADLRAMDAAAAAHLPSPCLAYPLMRTGERFPFLCERAEGFWLGIADNTTELYAAGLQGVALVERLAYDVLDRVAQVSGGEVFSTGGGSRSDVWVQCRADATRRVIHRPACTESAFGAAILAAAGSHFSGLDVAVEEMVHVERSFWPDGAKGEAYDRLYEQFCQELQRRGFL